MTQDDKLFLFRPTGIARADYQPLPEPVRVRMPEKEKLPCLNSQQHSSGCRHAKHREHQSLQNMPTVQQHMAVSMMRLQALVC